MEAEPPFSAVWRHQEFGLQVGTLRHDGLHCRGHPLTDHNALGLGYLQPVEDVFCCQLGCSWHEDKPWERHKVLSSTELLSTTYDLCGLWETWTLCLSREKFHSTAFSSSCLSPSDIPQDPGHWKFIMTLALESDGH